MKRLLDGYYRLLKVVMTFLMGLMIVPVLLQIVSRYTGIIPRYMWTEEIARFCFVWVIMVGSMIAVRDGSHFDVDLLPEAETPRQAGACRLVVHALMMLMSVVFVWYGCSFAKFGWMQTSEMSGINMLSIFAALPVAGVTWALFLVEKIARDMRLMAGQEPGAQEWDPAK